MTSHSPLMGRVLIFFFSFTQKNNVDRSLFHPVLFSVCQCRRCNWGLALDKGKKYPQIFAPLLADSLWIIRHAVASPYMMLRWTESPPPPKTFVEDGAVWRC